MKFYQFTNLEFSLVTDLSRDYEDLKNEKKDQQKISCILATFDSFIHNN